MQGCWWSGLMGLAGRSSSTEHWCWMGKIQKLDTQEWGCRLWDDLRQVAVLSSLSGDACLDKHTKKVTLVSFHLHLIASFSCYVTFVFSNLVFEALFGTYVPSFTRNFLIGIPVIRWHVEEAPQALCSIAVAHWLLCVSSRGIDPINSPCNREIL